MQVDEEEKTFSGNERRNMNTFSIDQPRRQAKRRETSYSAKAQIIVSIIQFLAIFIYVSLTHDSPYSELVAEIMVIAHGLVTFLLMLWPSLASDDTTRIFFLVVFIVTDTYIIHILSNAKWITGNLLDFLFFLCCALKSILYVERRFFPHHQGNTPKKQFIEANESVIAVLMLLLVLFYRHYVWQEDTSDVVFATTILQLLIILHWNFYTDKLKNQVLESILGYSFILAETYMLAATWPKFFLFDIVIFIGYVPRLLTYLGYDTPFQNFSVACGKYVETILTVLQENVETCLSGLVMVLCSIWACFDPSVRAFHLSHRDSLLMINLLKALLMFLLNIIPGIGRQKLLKPFLVIILTICESYVITFFDSFFVHARAFIILFTLMTLLKNIGYIYAKFGGPETSERCFGGFSIRGGIIVSFEGLLAVAIILYHHHYDSMYYHYNFLLSTFIISIFVFLELSLAPEGSIKAPLTYLLGIAYLLSECYSLSVLSNFIWTHMGDGMGRYVTVAAFIYTSIEKTSTYAVLMDPLYMWMAWGPFEEEAERRAVQQPEGQKYLQVEEEDL